MRRRGGALAAVAELLQAPVATSVSGKGCIPDAHPLAVGWGYGKQGTRAAEKAFKDVDLVLAVGVRYSEVSTASYAIPRHDTLIHVDANPQNLGRNVPAQVTLCSDARVFLDRLLVDGAAIRRPACPDLVAKRFKRSRQDDRCEAVSVKISPCVDPMFFMSQFRMRARPGRAHFRRRDRGHALGCPRRSRFRARAGISRRPTTRAWAGRSRRPSAPSGFVPIVRSCA